MAPDCIKKFGGRFLVRGGRHVVPEGTTRTRNTIVEFPSYDAAVQCYHSADYQAARQKRIDVASMDLVIIEGFSAAEQPSEAVSPAKSERSIETRDH